MEAAGLPCVAFDPAGGPAQEASFGPDTWHEAKVKCRVRGCTLWDRTFVLDTWEVGPDATAADADAPNALHMPNLPLPFCLPLYSSSPRCHVIAVLWEDPTATDTPMTFALGGALPSTETLRSLSLRQWQAAAQELAKADLPQLLATVFDSDWVAQAEGGGDDEEFLAVDAEALLASTKGGNGPPSTDGGGVQLGPLAAVGAARGAGDAADLDALLPGDDGDDDEDPRGLLDRPRRENEDDEEGDMQADDDDDDDNEERHGELDDDAVSVEQDEDDDDPHDDDDDGEGDTDDDDDDDGSVMDC
jgi:hypothetical protein